MSNTPVHGYTFTEYEPSPQTVIRLIEDPSRFIKNHTFNFLGKEKLAKIIKPAPKNKDSIDNPTLAWLI